MPSIVLIHSTLRLIHSLTTVGRLCNVLLKNRELRPCCLHIRGCHHVFVPPDAQHAIGIATKVANRPERGPTARRPSGSKSLQKRRFEPTWDARRRAAFLTVCDFRRDSNCMLGVGRHKSTMGASNSAVDRPDSQQFTAHSQSDHRWTIV